MTNRPLPICRFDARKHGLERWVGPQEAAVLDALWTEARALTVKAAWRLLQRDYKQVAYTTVLTTMTRMWEKALLDRTKRGLSYVYSARETREEFVARQIEAIQRSLEETE